VTWLARPATTNRSALRLSDFAAGRIDADEYKRRALDAQS